MATKTKAEALVLTRVFDAPRALVWKAWTDPTMFQQWWGPKGFTSPSSRMDVRAGGTYLWCMRGPDGRDAWSTGTYREVVPMERLVYTDAFSGAGGRVVPPSEYGLPDDWAVERLVTVTFQDQKGGTKLTVRYVGLPAGTMREMAGAGWSQSFDKLAAALGAGGPASKPALTVTLPSDREIVLTRAFNAPRELVFEAHSRAEHLKRWWGPRRLEITICEVDFRPGGAWRTVMRESDGREYGFRGEFREIVPPERIVRTFEFEGTPGHISVETLTLIPNEGGTTLITRSVFATAEDRDAMLRSEMEQGAREVMDRLAELLATLRGDR